MQPREEEVEGEYLKFAVEDRIHNSPLCGVGED